MELSREFLNRYCNVKKRNEVNERLVTEMKKQFQSYQDEIEHMKRVQDKINASSFMTLTHDFNTLLDHYTMVRTINKKLKHELHQSGEREK